MKKRIWIGGAILLLGVAITAVGLYFWGWHEVAIHLSSDYNGFVTENMREARGHETLLPEYNTDVSIAFQNKDGTKTLYVFSSPIRFQNGNGQLSLIDIRLANVREEGLRNQGYLYTVAKYSLQGTTQGRYLTGGVLPVRFSM